MKTAARDVTNQVKNADVRLGCFPTVEGDIHDPVPDENSMAESELVHRVPSSWLEVA